MLTPRRGFPSRRWAVRTGLPAAAGLALVAGLIAATLPAQAQSATSPAAGHPYRRGVVPTRSALADIRAHSAVQQDSANNLVYRGGVDGIGVTTGAPKVYVVFYGTQWGTKSTDSKGNAVFTGDPAHLAPRLQLMFKGLGTNNEQWSGTMTQYCEGVATNAQSCPANAARVGYPFGGALAGVWYDNGAASPQVSTAHQLAVEAVRAANHFGNTNAALNRDAQYFIVSPHGTSPDGFLTSDFCAWHDWNGDTSLDGGGAATSAVGDVAFTNMPYVTDGNCWANLVNAGSAGTLDGVTVVGGHEYAETITDQNPAGGWTDNSLPVNQENGDKCLGQPGAAGNIAFATGTFAMQATWSNDANSGTGGCALTHAIVDQDPFTVGYVWNDSPSGTGCHVPNTFYSYSSRANPGTNTICRTGTGAYTVHFAGLASKGGNAQVSAYGGSPVSCKVSSWSASKTEELVKVNCFSFSGTAQDSFFTASFAKGGGAANTIAFLLADQPTNTSSYTPSTTFQYNNSGGHATVKRTGTGRYTVTIPQAGAPSAGSVKVSAVGTGSGWCKVVGWFPNAGATAQQVNVACNSSSGSASDQKFSLVFVNNMNLIGDNRSADAYVWADQPTAASYTPNTLYQHDTTIASSGTITISRAGVGVYDVLLPFQDQGWDGGHVAVTAYGSGTERCQINFWGGASGGRTAEILCFTNSGSPVDTLFVMEYTARLQ
jgi:hypothetical protein